MKVTVKQVNPSYQTPFDEWEADVEMGNLSILGNSDYHEHLSEDVERVLSALRRGYMWGYLSYCKRKEIAREFIEEHLPKKSGSYSYDEISTLESKIHYFCNIGSCNLTYWSNLDALCEILSVVTGESYSWKRLTGCVQGEWNYAVYPSDMWNEKTLEMLETEYFNLGSEWIVDDTFHIYFCDDDISKLPSRIIGEYADEGDEIIIYKWVGQRMVDIYETVS